MGSLINKEGKIITDKVGICNIAVDFYKTLMTAKPIDENKLQQVIDRNIDKRLSDDQKNSIEGLFTKEEILRAIKDMKNNKSPGIDGLTREFYIIMWDVIGNDLIDVIANVCLQDQLPESWTEGLVTLIFKEKGDVNDLKNWRPITLLNTDYKIMTKALANRMRKVAGHVVNLDQSCEIQKRSIHDELFFIRDFMHFYHENNKSAILITNRPRKMF